LVFELNDQAIATSGDYRNYFEFEGQRYSHTIDPRTGRPVVHNIASVSVFADDCMTADGWATALNVLGVEKGIPLAEQRGLEVRMVERIAEDEFASKQTSHFPDSIPLQAEVR
jgi:thiamine biosynthesis lipoprotein